MSIWKATTFMFVSLAIPIFLPTMNYSQRFNFYLFFLSLVQAFKGRGGKAYLFNSVFLSQNYFFYLNFLRVNIITGPKEQRILLTGLHTVCDIFCKGCNNNVGWKYVKKNQLLLLNHFILKIRNLLSKSRKNIKKENSFWKKLI